MLIGFSKKNKTNLVPGLWQVLSVLRNWILADTRAGQPSSLSASPELHGKNRYDLSGLEPKTWHSSLFLVSTEWRFSLFPFVRIVATTSLPILHFPRVTAVETDSSWNFTCYCTRELSGARPWNSCYRPICPIPDILIRLFVVEKACTVQTSLRV